MRRGAGERDKAYLTTNARMAKRAERMVGAPYRWGGTTPAGFDCSGLVYYAYRELGITPPRTTRDLYSASRAVERAEMQVGDLLFFRLDGRRVSHVGIYLGRGRFVHAPARGQQVAYASLSAPFWRERFVRAGRLSTGWTLLLDEGPTVAFSAWR